MPHMVTERGTKTLREVCAIIVAGWDAFWQRRKLADVSILHGLGLLTKNILVRAPALI